MMFLTICYRRVTVKNTREKPWLFSFVKDMCEISEIEVISWNGKWERIEASDFGVRLKINNNFMADNNIDVSILKAVEVFNLIIVTLSNDWSKMCSISRFGWSLYCTTLAQKTIKDNLDGCSSTGQALGLLPRDHQFESHKPQDHWRFTWSLTSGHVVLVKMRANWSGNPR